MTVYELVTKLIVEKLQQGVVPWRKPWSTNQDVPRNLVSRKPYRGVNVLLLSMLGFDSPWFLTFKQALTLGGCVRKGERGCPVVFWKFPKADDEDETDPEPTGRAPLLRYYTVFHVTQCDGLPVAPAAAPAAAAFSPIDSAARIVAGMPDGPAIVHGGDRAAYAPSLDRIVIPRPEHFSPPEAYYNVLFHELTHSTGHQSRLNRPEVTEPIRFGSHAYSAEELVAEIGAAFLCGHSGIAPATVDNSAAYIASWLSKLGSDPRLVVFAAAEAQKAADRILGAPTHQPAETAS